MEGETIKALMRAVTNLPLASPHREAVSRDQPLQGKLSQQPCRSCHVTPHNADVRFSFEADDKRIGQLPGDVSGILPSFSSWVNPVNHRCRRLAADDSLTLSVITDLLQTYLAPAHNWHWPYVTSGSAMTWTTRSRRRCNLSRFTIAGQSSLRSATAMVHLAPLWLSGVGRGDEDDWDEDPLPTRYNSVGTAGVLQAAS